MQPQVALDEEEGPTAAPYDMPEGISCWGELCGLGHSPETP